MVGLIDKEEHITTQWFEDEGDVIILVGSVAGGADPGRDEPDHKKEAEVNALGYSLGGSRYLKVCYGLKVGPPPQLDLQHEVKIQNAVRDLIRAGLVKSAHDCSEGGLAVTVAECCFNPEGLFGADIECSHGPEGTSRETSRSDVAMLLFNESQSRIIISVAHKNLGSALTMLRQCNVPFQQLGKVGGDELRIRIDEQTFRWPVGELYDDWWNAIGRAVEEEESIPSL
jgi:phosphoribosylformylglycinamidine synthase subunit PurL